jgi:hypothetical protein
MCMSKDREPASRATEGARRATGGAPEERRDGRGRRSAKRKFAAVLRQLRGEDRGWYLLSAKVRSAFQAGVDEGKSGLTSRSLHQAG